MSFMELIQIFMDQIFIFMDIKFQLMTGICTLKVINLFSYLNLISHEKNMYTTLGIGGGIQSECSEMDPGSNVLILLD